MQEPVVVGHQDQDQTQQNVQSDSGSMLFSWVSGLQLHEISANRRCRIYMVLRTVN